MGLAWFFRRQQLEKFLVLSICFLYLSLLVNSGPIRKKKVRSAVTQKQDQGNLMLNNVSSKSENTHKGQQDAANIPAPVIAKPDNSNRHDPAAVVDLSSKLQNNTVADEKVGQLPLPQVPETNSILKDSDKFKAKIAEVNLKSNKADEQGVAVGVGAMNREPAMITKAEPVYHNGPDNSLDVGAADRKSKSNDSAADNNIVTNSNLNNKKADESPLNPALQQPPPQAREPPVNQFGEKEAHLGPMNPQQGVKSSRFEKPKTINKQDERLNQVEQQVDHPKMVQERLDQIVQPEDIQPEDKPIIVQQPEMVQQPIMDQQPIEHHGARENSNDVLKFKKEISMADTKLEINPPDHMEGIRMEKDGHLNRDYKKEIFFGHHDEFEWSDEEKVSGKLRLIFRRADKNSDHFLTQIEIQDWIKMNVKVHLDDAVKDNARVFKHLDADKDGFVSWTEFFSHFLVAKGYAPSAVAARKIISSVKLDIEDNERILKYKYRWAEVNELNSEDDKLDINEMMNFRHPEQSKQMNSELVKDLISTVDKNGDGVITEKEFIALPHELEDEERLPVEENWQEERRKEFREVIDLNNDGIADVNELKVYFDPHNVNHARLEAENLIRSADADEDGKLSIEEILDNADLFIGSKMVNAKKKLHDEF